MPKRALIIFDKCEPGKCSPEGICAAAKACPRKLLKQEKAGEIPLPDPSLCQACSDCARACPMKAIILVRE